MDFLQPLILPYLNLLTDPLANGLMLLFTGLSFLQLWRGWQQLAQMRGKWAQWRAEPLSNWKKGVGEVLAFYVGVPVGVLIHELGHAVVVWALGGRVLEFGFFFFWGYVLPSQRFNLSQEWVLSSAGTWGSLLFALVVALIWWRHKSTAVRYAARRTVRYQIFFALIYYPLFTAVLSFGDWRTIYDFTKTPRLSGATAIIHALILLGFWLADRRGVFSLVAHDSAEKANNFQQLQTEARLNPQDFNQQKAYLGGLLQAGEIRQAQAQALQMTKKWPDSAEAHYFVLITQWNHAETRIPAQAIKHAREALRLGLSATAHRANVHHVLGLYERELGRMDTALEHFNQAITFMQSLSPTDQNPYLHTALYHRALLFRNQNKKEAARQDLNAALQHLRRLPNANPSTITHYEQLIKTL